MHVNTKHCVNEIYRSTNLNIGKSTRMESQEVNKINKYQCEKYSFNSSYKDKFLMHVYTKHRGEGVNETDRNMYDKTVVNFVCGSYDIITDLNNHTATQMV